CLRRAFVFQKCLQPGEWRLTLRTTDKRPREHSYHLVEKTRAFKTERNQRPSPRNMDRFNRPDGVLFHVAAVDYETGVIVRAAEQGAPGTQEREIEWHGNVPS